MQTLAHRSCARSLRRAARAALMVITLSSFRCSRRRCVGHGSRRRGVVHRRHGGGRSNLRLQRPLCGLTVLQGLQPAGLDHWNSGSLYNPDDGQTYRISAELRSADVFVARVYLGVPLFGETKTLLRVPRLRSEGWC